MNKLFSLAALFTAIACTAQAQIISDTEPITIPVDGFIVTNSGDTLVGKVNVTQTANYVTQISFRDKDGKKTKYSPNDLMAFTQKRPKMLRDFADLTTIDKNQVHYESHEHPKKAGKKVFMERLMDGSKIKLYNNPVTEGSTSIGGFKISENDASFVVIKNGEKPYILKRKNYEEEFDSLFGDCPAFAAYVKTDDGLKKFKKLGTVVENYNKRCE